MTYSPRYSTPRNFLLSNYKAFLRPHLDNYDVIYNKLHYEKFIDTLKSIQYNATLAITGAVGTSKKTLFNELDLEYLRGWQWMQRLCLFHKMFDLKSPNYLYTLIPSITHFYDTINNTYTPSFNCTTEHFMNSFFTNVINEWNKRGITITIITSDNTFKNSLLSFIRPLNIDIFGIHNSVELQLLARLRLGLSYLNEHKFKHNFRDFLNLLCSCIVKPETTSHYLLRCHLLQIQWRTLFNYIKEIDEHITTDHKN